MPIISTFPAGGSSGAVKEAYDLASAAKIAADAAQQTADNAANAESLAAHIRDKSAHVSEEERSAWNGVVQTANNAVPETRKVNGKPLSTDITLSAADVGARASDWNPSLGDLNGVLPVSKGGTGVTSIENFVSQLNTSGKVPRAKAVKYVGTGLCGSNYPTVINFGNGFIPDIIFICGGSSYGSVTLCKGSSSTVTIAHSESWATAFNVTSDVGSSSTIKIYANGTEMNQYNVQGSTYTCFGIEIPD